MGGVMAVAKPRTAKPKSKFTSRKSWREKLEKKQVHEIVPLEGKFAAQFGAGTMLIPRPLDVDALIRKVPPGKLVTLSGLRRSLAKSFGTTTTCPMCTGIFCRIAAEAAEEALGQGATDITPYWRVVTDEGRLNPKWPGGIPGLTKKLKAEGHVVVKAEGKKAPQVKGFEEALVGW